MSGWQNAFDFTRLGMEQPQNYTLRPLKEQLEILLGMVDEKTFPRPEQFHPDVFRKAALFLRAKSYAEGEKQQQEEEETSPTLTATQPSKKRRFESLQESEQDEMEEEKEEKEEKDEMEVA